MAFRALALPLALLILAKPGAGVSAQVPAPPGSAAEIELDPADLRSAVVVSWEHPSAAYKRAVRSAIAERFPDVPEGLFSRAWLAADPRQAVSRLRAGVDADPSFAEAWLNLETRLWNGMSRRAEARAVLDEGIRAVSTARPDRAGLLLARRAERLAEEHRFAEAEATARKAVERSPTLPDPRLTLCELLNADARIEECLTVMQEGLTLRPGSARLALELARIYLYQRHDHARARRQYEQAVALSGRDPYYVGQLGVWHRDAAHDYETAVAHFRSAGEASGDGYWLLRVAEAQDDDLGDEARSLATSDVARAQATPDDAGAARRMARLLAKGGEADGLRRAEAILREALEKSRYDPELWTDLAALVERDGRGGEAFEILRRGAESLPWSWWVNAKYAGAVAQRDLEGGIRILERWLGEYPDSPEGLDHLTALMYRSPAHREASVDLIVRGLRLDPDHSYLNNRLQELYTEHLPDRERPGQLLLELFRETGIEEFLLQAAHYRKERLADLEGAVRLLADAIKRSRSAGRDLPRAIDRAGEYVLQEGSDAAVREGLKLWDSLAAGRPDDLDLQLRRLGWLRQLRMGQRLQRLAEELLRRFPDAPRLHDELASYWRLHDLDRARAHAERAGRDRPLRLAEIAWISGDFDAALRHYERAERQRDTNYYRADALRRLREARSKRPADGARVVLQMVDGVGIMSPDRRRSAQWTGGIVWIRDVPAGRIANWFEVDGTELHSFGPDGRSILVGEETYLWRVYDVVTGELRGAVPAVGRASWSADGKRIAQTWDLGITVHELATGRLLRQVAVQADYVANAQGFEWSPDERFFAIAYRTPGDHSVVVVDAATGKVVHDLSPRHPQLARHRLNGWAHDVRFSPDGRRLAFSIEGERAAFVLDMNTGEVVAGDHRWAPRAFEFSGDGGRLAWLERDGATWRAIVARADDLTERGRFEVEKSCHPFFAADDDHLYCHKLYRVADGVVVDAFDSPAVDARYPRVDVERLELIDWKGRRSLSWDLSRGNALVGADLPDGIDVRPRDDAEADHLWTAGPGSVVYKPRDRPQLVEVSRETGRVRRALPFLDGHELWALRIDPTGRRLVGVYVEPLGEHERTAWVSERANLDVFLDLIDLQTGERTGTARTSLVDDRYETEIDLKLSLGRCGVDQFAFSRDGSRFLATFQWSLRQRRPGLASRALKVRDSTSGEVRNDIRLNRRATALAFSAAGDQLAVGDEHGSVHLYDITRAFEEERVAAVTAATAKEISALAERDGEWLVAHGRTLERWDLARGRRTATLPGHMAAISHVLPVTGRERVLTIAGQEVTVWSLETNQRLATLLAFADGGWLSFTPEGWYHASLEGDQELYWALRGELTRFDVYESSLRSPQAVYETLRFGEVQTGDVATRRARDVVHLPRPRVTLLSPADGATLNTKKAVLRVRVQAAGEPVREVHVRQDGTGVAGVILDKAETAAGPMEVELPLTLFEGANRLEVYAQTEKARSDLASLRLTYRPGPAPSDRSLGRLRFVGIGISDHEDDHYDLHWAHKDARDLADALRAATTELYLEPANVDVVVDAAARREAILERIRAAVDACQADDTLVVFLAGHGMHWRNRLFFFAHDSREERLYSTGVWWQQLELVLGESACRRTLVLLDTCHAGDFYERPASSGRGARLAGIPSIDPHAEELARGSGVRVLAACRGEQQSLEDARWENGAFTEALLEGIAGAADHDGDGAVSVLELELFARKRVGELTEGKQTPVGKSEGAFRDYPLVKLQ